MPQRKVFLVEYSCRALLIGNCSDPKCAIRF